MLNTEWTAVTLVLDARLQQSQGHTALWSHNCYFEGNTRGLQRRYKVIRLSYSRVYSLQVGV